MEREKELYELTSKGKTGARKLRRAHILLLADEVRTETGKYPKVRIPRFPQWNPLEDALLKAG